MGLGMLTDVLASDLAVGDTLVLYIAADGSEVGVIYPAAGEPGD